MVAMRRLAVIFANVDPRIERSVFQSFGVVLVANTFGGDEEWYDHARHG